MKQILLLSSILFTAFFAGAQNIYPATGNVGIGTNTPATALDVNGAISIKGFTQNETRNISVPSDGTYVVASGAYVKGTYTLNFEAGNRVQMVDIIASAVHYDYNSSLTILSNVSYGGSVVMSNFRLLFNSDASIVYLVFDIGNRNGGTLVTANFNGTGAYNPSWGGTLPATPTNAGVYPLVVNMSNVGIGTTNTQGYKLAVNGSAIATSMTVKLYANWPDYVFNKNYRLPALSDVKNYIDQNHHLPEMPSEKEVAKDGVNLGEMNRLLTKKVEELTLYIIEIEKEEKEQQTQIAKQNAQLETTVQVLANQEERLKKMEMKMETMPKE